MNGPSRERVAADIARYGWGVCGVFPVAGQPGQPGLPLDFCYTYGFWHSWRHPEFMTFALRPQMAHAFFSELARRIAAGERFTDGQVVEGLAAGYATRFRSAPNDDPEYPCALATQFYGHTDYPVLQMVLPDKHGHWPWEPDCDAMIAISQQLLVRDGLATSDGELRAARLAAWLAGHGPEYP